MKKNSRPILIPIFKIRLNYLKNWLADKVKPSMNGLHANQNFIAVKMIRICLFEIQFINENR